MTWVILIPQRNLPFVPSLWGSKSLFKLLHQHLLPGKKLSVRRPGCGFWFLLLPRVMLGKPVIPGASVSSSVKWDWQWRPLLRLLVERQGNTVDCRLPRARTVFCHLRYGRDSYFSESANLWAFLDSSERVGWRRNSEASRDQNCVCTCFLGDNQWPTVARQGFLCLDYASYF